MQREPLYRRVRELIKAEKLIEPGERLVVAVSGGADSIVLLELLSRLRSELELTLHVAHLDHALRSDSAQDADFVADQARRRGLACTCARVEVRELARRRRRSLEDAGRQARREFLLRVAEEQRAQKIALGHTQDDQVETFFLRLIRGAGPAGLAGMRPRQDPFIRPLLGCSRREVRRYAALWGLAYREDATNRDLRFRRNWIRHRLLPQLQAHNPRLSETLVRTQAIFAELADLLEEQAERALEALLIAQDEAALVLERAGYAALHPALQAEVVRRAAARLAGGPLELAAERVRSARAAADKTGRRVELGGGLLWTVEPHALRLDRRPASRQSWPPVPLKVPGTTRWGPWRLRARLVAPDGCPSEPTRPRLAARLDWGKIKPPLRVRSRRPGDAIDPPGLGGHKKLQDLLVDAKVPRGQRDEIPLIEDAQGLLWVVSQAESARARLDTSTRTVLALEAERRDAPPPHERNAC